MPLFKSKPFNGDRLNQKWTGKPRLFVSFDIGATHTAVAVAILTPRLVPSVVHISRWPGQEDRIYEEKVPTVVLYDRAGQVVACGAEALSRKNENMADEEGWTLAKNFKLRLHPAAVIEKNNLSLDVLPWNVPLSKVYADFLTYVMKHTRSHLRADTGTDPWSSNVEIILAHPNGWGRHEQDFLTTAAISAGLIKDNEESKKRIYFVEEAEASARYCVSASATAFASQLRKGSKFIICDAGGSTVDITAYEVESLSSDKMKLNELQVPSCVAAGGLHVDAGLSRYMQKLLSDSLIYDEDTIRDLIRDGMKDFQQHGKREFVSQAQDLSIQVAWRNVNDPSLHITHGTMSLNGALAESFFNECVEVMVEALKSQLDAGGIQHVILTGGFGESPYVKQRLTKEFPARECGVVVANSSNSKAVAVGALMLAMGGGNVVVDRQKRSFQTWVTNFATLSKILSGVFGIVAAVLPMAIQQNDASSQND